MTGRRQTSREPRAAPIGDFVHEQLPQRIVFGWGRLGELPAELDRLSARRVLIISERSTGSIAEEIGRRLGDRVVAAAPPVHAHVPRADVDASLAEARASGVDSIVTVGGGSATGVGKAVVLDHPCSLVAIPTTYSGSEVTPIYGTTEAGRKRTGRDERVLPKTVLYDPQLTISLPPRVTAASGMNALAHCVEALYAEGAGPIADVLAEEAIRVLRRALPACVADPANEAGRAGALFGAYLAGTVLATTGMAIHHRICQVIGGRFGVAHGDVNAVVLPHAVAFNEPAASEAIARVAEALDAAAAAPALFELSRSLGAPTSLRELGMSVPDLDEAAALVVEGSFYNPRPADRHQVLRILEAAFEGRPPEPAPRDGMDET